MQLAKKVRQVFALARFEQLMVVIIQDDPMSVSLLYPAQKTPRGSEGGKAPLRLPPETQRPELSEPRGEAGSHHHNPKTEVPVEAVREVPETAHSGR